eukprot:TRINITY_DN59896_c0_g1_i1.p1 TRINITY_DN59896_c0_g1~~TRINITY_DN59896_c0_g1_i1.p1  ORF type:complete len:277 (-),score=29.34 TRINITY_DN59896_c0_g1_i1:848-1678(-)
MAVALDMWFMRVAREIDPPPAIVLLYLWDSTLFTPIFPQSSAWRAQRAVIRHWLEQGLDISVVNVGATLAKTCHDNKTKVLRDETHPNCIGNEYIANLLRYHFVGHMSAAPDGDTHGQAATRKRCIAKPERNATRAWKPLLLGAFGGPVQIFLQSSTIGSLVMWQPQEGHSNLKVAQAETGRDTELLHGAKVDAGRQDRKFVYKLPPCYMGWIDFTIHNPGLKAVTLGFGGGYSWSQEWNGRVMVKINGVPAVANLDDEAAMDTWRDWDWNSNFPY